MLQKQLKLSSKIYKIELDDAHIIKRPAIVESERSIAIRDLLKSNSFRLNSELGVDGPYYLKVGIKEHRLHLFVKGVDDATHLIKFPLQTFRRLIKDYFLICESFMEATAIGDRYKVETLDMARRGIHNEGALLLKDALSNDLEMTITTARSLFTLICVMHI